MRALTAAFASTFLFYTFSAAALALALVAAPMPAWANGRFPKAQAIALPPGGDGQTVYLRATFGVLVSHDGGRSWRWFCEQALGFSSTWDPPIAVTRDSRLWVALMDGARTTTNGCGADEIPGLHGELVADFAVDGAGTGVFAVTSPPGAPAFVWRSAGPPSKPAFKKLGSGVAGFRFDTIEVAPSSPSRLYLTATPEGKGAPGHLFRSDDGGGTLTEVTPSLPVSGRLFVSAVDPQDPDRVYVRLLSDSGSDVLLSTDGGKTLTRVLHMKGAMFGFARTPDGKVVYAGSGDPREGIWRSTDRGATWNEGAKTSVFCLNAEGPDLLVCSNPYTPGGYAVGRSSDRGATVQPLGTFDEVVGPVACDAGPSPCASAWPETRAAIVTEAHLRPPVVSAAEPVDAAAVPDSGTKAPPPPAPRACACRAAGTPSSVPSLALFVPLLTLGLARGGRTRNPGSRRARITQRFDHPT